MLDQAKKPLTDLLLERMLVAKILADNSVMARIGKLAKGDLVDVAASAAFDAAVELAADGRPINLATLKPMLATVRTGFDKTAIDTIAADPMMRLPAGSVASESYRVEDMAARLRMLATRRRLAEYLDAIANAAVDETVAMGEIAADCISQCNDFIAETHSERKTDFVLYDSAQDFIERLQSDDDPIEIPTGLTDLDNATGGHHRGQFTILAGRPSMGKSCIALSSMLRTAEKGFGVLFFSLEMTRDQVTSRALSDYAYTDPRIDYFHLRPGNVNPAQVRRLYDAAERFKQMPIVIETKSGLTIGEIFARARKVKEDFAKRGISLALVVIDHLLKVRPSERYAGQPVKELDEVSEGCCAIAKSLDAAVLGLHQLNRGVESRDNPRPLMSDLRGSGSLEQDADTVLLAYRPAYRFERQLDDPDKRAEAEIEANALKHDLELQVAKQRSGPPKSLEFFCDMAANVVRDKNWRH
jgi:replicative DNA helicase